MESVEVVLGVDIGSETAVLSLLPLSTIKPEILRNDLAAPKTPVYISFHNGVRSFGDSAKQLMTIHKESTFGHLIDLIFETDEAESIIGTKTVMFQGQEYVLRAEELLAMFMKKLISFVHNSVSYSPAQDKGFDLQTKVACSLVIPECCEEKQRGALFTACEIAGIKGIELIERTTSAAISNATRKSPEQMHGTNVMYVDVGHGIASAAVFHHKSEESGREIIHVASVNSKNLGSKALDKCIFDALVVQLKGKYGGSGDIKASSRSGSRLMGAARKIKESLSGVPVAEATCENLIEGQDVRLSMSREQFETAAHQYISDFNGLFDNLVQKCKDVDPSFVISACEVIGGGMRVAFVADAIQRAAKALSNDSVDLGYTLDPMSTNSTGACYHLAKSFEPGAIHKPIFDVLPSSKDSFGIYKRAGAQLTMTSEELMLAKELQARMDEADRLNQERDALRNKFEGYIFEMQSAANGNRKYSSLIKKEACLKIISAAENWLHEADNDDTIFLSTADFKAKFEELEISLKESCGEYFDKIASEEKRKEKEFEDISQKAAQELEDAGGKDDHDFRKLSKPERMKKVVMNKDEGNSLFKDGNIEPASLRYKRALQHCDKFFDLSPEDKKEVEEIKLNLYLNLAMCQIKTENNDLALQSLNDALAIDKENPKALYRRAVVLEKKGDFAAAKKDLLKAQTLEPEEKTIEKLMERIDAQLAREKAKQKKMAQKMFG